jgi:hypothetical protein
MPTPIRICRFLTPCVTRSGQRSAPHASEPSIFFFTSLLLSNKQQRDTKKLAANFGAEFFLEFDRKVLNIGLPHSINMRRGGTYACVACDLDFDSCSRRGGEGRAHTLDQLVIRSDAAATVRVSAVEIKAGGSNSLDGQHQVFSLSI